MSGTNQTLGGGGLHHVAINSRDFDKSVAFYTEVLGFEPKLAWGEPPKRAIMLDTGQRNYLEIFEKPDLPPIDDSNPGVIHFAVRTDDTDKALEAARAQGCEVTMEPKSVDIAATIGTNPTPVRIAFFKGPDGEHVELFQNELT